MLVRNNNMDEAESIDLALNSNFDSALLDCWEEATNEERHRKEDDNDDGRNGGDTDDDNDEEDQDNDGNEDCHHHRAGGSEASSSGSAGGKARFDRLPSFTMDHDDGVDTEYHTSMNSSPTNGMMSTNASADASADAAVATAAAVVAAATQASPHDGHPSDNIPHNVLHHHHVRDAGRTSYQMMNNGEQCSSATVPAPVSAGASTATAPTQASSSSASGNGSSINHSGTNGSGSMEASIGNPQNHHPVHGGGGQQQQQQQQSMSTQLHPLAIQASAQCPPHESTTSNNTGNGGNGSGAIQNHPSSGANGGAMYQTHHNNTMGASGMGSMEASVSELQQNHNAALLPLALNALAAGASINFPYMQEQQQQQLHQYKQHQQYQQQQQQQQQQTTVAVPNSNGNVAGSVTSSLTGNVSGGNDSNNAQSSTSAAPQMHSTSTNLAASVTTSQQGRKRNNDASSSQRRQANSQRSSATTSAPPFLLFDAPVELRKNFEQSQRAHGLPVLQDNNAYHFGIAVNGFHPQNLHGANLIPNVRLIDARHGDVGEKRIKNAKEQKRAQRIAELIDELRDEMEKGGWDVGHKSKYNTLSSCAQYVRHLVKVTREKEKAVQQARCDLEAKRSKIEDDKAQQDRSDPESTTSSLTVSSRSATDGEAKRPNENYGNGQGQGTTGENKKRQVTSENEGANDKSTSKKPRLKTHESSLSSASSGGGDDNGADNKRPAGVKSIAMDQTTSSVSDLTDSNKGSSSNGDFGQGRATSGRSISSDAAVADEKEKANAEKSDHADVLVRKRKSKKTHELASLAADFEIDYEEVFVKSNVPQCIATTAGKIIAWNEFFLKATGLPEKRIESATIFSLVQTNKLSSLFEIVAKSLKSADPGPEPSTSDDEKNKEVNFDAMTLPCSHFHTTGGPSQLYITVTIMPDEDPRKRCFHCLLTDSPCTEGEIGQITPELLGMLFKPQPGKKFKHHHHKKRTKQNIEKQQTSVKSS